MKKASMFVLAMTVVATLASLRSVSAQGQPQPPTGGRAAAGPPAPGGPQGAARGPQTPQGGAPIPFDDHTGFKQIFDGTTLTGWDGDPAFWKAENGAIVGQSTQENAVKQNTFIIYRGGEPADFELKLEWRMSSTNSGIQYRSQQLPPGSQSGNETIGKWVLKGYQADIDFANQYTGQLYEERGRGFLALRGAMGYFGPTQPGPRGPLATLESGDALKAYIKQNDWNQMQIIARGNVMIHVLNGHVTAVFVDDDAAGRAMKGLLGFQMHVGPPMKVEFRNIYLKTL